MLVLGLRLKLELRWMSSSESAIDVQMKEYPATLMLYIFLFWFDHLILIKVEK